jgi:hypothetical protein
MKKSGSAVNGGKPKSGRMGFWAGCSTGTLLLRRFERKRDSPPHSFGNPSQLPTPLQDEYGAFAQHFVTSFAPEIFKVYLEQIELYVSGQAWLSKKCQYQILQFFTEWFVLLLFHIL